MFSSNGLGGGSGIGGDLSNIFQGFFGNSGKPYKAAEKELNDFYNRARESQNPFLDFGKRGMPMFEEWLGKMKDPSGFINNLMGGYNESPYAKFQQEQAMRSAQNMGSASGLTGSTPLTQFAQQNARDISSQDMNQWLQNVLGINTQYGAGLNQQIGYGQHAADQLSGINSDFGKMIAEMQYGKHAAEQQQKAQGWGGLFNLGEKAAKAYFGGGM